MDKVVITGGTGFIGMSLAKYLANKGFEPILIARNEPKGAIPFTFLPWDGRSLGDWVEALEGAKAVVNLAGKTVDCIKTPDNCDLILRSRVASTRALGKALTKVQRPPLVWVQMSTAHIYGDPPSTCCTESSSFGYGLAPFVGEQWEKAFLDSLPRGVRGVRLRTSFVIGKEGGALPQLKKIVRMGIGGRVAQGKQGMSWIHEDDLNELILQSILNEHFEGAYIASAPNPLSNRDFMKQLRQAMSMPFGLAAPAWMIRLGARIVFKTDPDLVLYGRYLKSERLESAGFSFKFPNLNAALSDLI
ncbi:MAG: DUF1731 domain-containing protein [Bacteroidota bacterium]